jgi:hypothetical protein
VVVASDVSFHGRLSERTSGITRKSCILITSTWVWVWVWVSGSSSSEEGVLGGCLQVLYLPSLGLFSSRRLRGYTRLQKPPPFSSLLCLFGSDKAAIHTACSLTFCVRGCLSHCEPDQTDQTDQTTPHQARPGHIKPAQSALRRRRRSCPLFASALPASACLPLGYFLPSRGASDSPIHHRSLLVCHPHIG